MMLGKKIKGRKRHIITDTMGLLWGVVVHAANISEREGGKIVLEKILKKWKRGRIKTIEKVLADAGYTGQNMIDWVRQKCGVIFEIVKRSELHKFVVLPKRWIVERTFGWIGRYRRMSKDYEYLPKSSENMIYLCMIKNMLQRLAK